VVNARRHVRPSVGSRITASSYWSGKATPRSPLSASHVTNHHQQINTHHITSWQQTSATTCQVSLCSHPPSVHATTDQLPHVHRRLQWTARGSVAGAGWQGRSVCWGSVGQRRWWCGVWWYVVLCLQWCAVGAGVGGGCGVEARGVCRCSRRYCSGKDRRYIRRSSSG